MHPRLLLVAIRLLTRLPLGDPADHDSDVAGSVAWFAVVGALIGGVSAIVWWSGSLALPRLAAASLAILTTTILTGALQENGLADTADAVFGTHSIDKRLAIMSSPTLGTYGSIALIVTFVLRASLVAALSPVAGAAALVVTASLSRGATAVAMVGTAPAREDGRGLSYLDDLAPWAGVVALATGVVATAALAGLATIAIVAGAIAAPLGLRFVAVRRLGGLTTDVLGAMIMLSEVVGMAILVGLQVGSGL